MLTNWIKSFIIVAGMTLSLAPATTARAESPFSELRSMIEEAVQNIDSHEIQPKTMDSELLCMAETVYFESGKEPTMGKLAVAQAIKNRLESPLYPKTVCKVVKMRTQIGERIVCQFTPYCGPRPALPTNPNHKNYQEWVESIAVAKLVLDKPELLDITKGAQNFYAHNVVKPNWGGRVTLRIGGHTFVRKN